MCVYMCVYIYVGTYVSIYVLYVYLLVCVCVYLYTGSENFLFSFKYHLKMNTDFTCGLFWKKILYLVKIEVDASRGKIFRQVSLAIWEFSLYHSFDERPILKLVFTNSKESKKIFTLWGGKKRSAFVLQQAIIEATYTHSSESGLAKLLPGSYTQCQIAEALNNVCEHLYVILIYFVQLLARCVLSYQKRLRELVRVLTLNVKLDVIKHFDYDEEN